MQRRVVWIQLLIGWLPVGALFATMISVAHGVPVTASALIALRMMCSAAALGLLVHRIAERLPWPHQVRVPFVLTHLALAVAYAFAWLALNSLIESVLRWQLMITVGYSLNSFILLGIWLYVMVAGVSYTSSATERVARAETNATKSQLAALRSQLNPHFLFNALHTVVQLIPREPRRAAQAAELLAGLLRGTIDEERDLVTVAEEWAFVERYLELERIRFGERLRVHVEISDEARVALVPHFAVQTLVENAVRHGAEPHIATTDITVRAVLAGGQLRVAVRDTGVGLRDDAHDNGKGTGLARLRERLAVLYGRDARLDAGVATEGGFLATITMPHVSDA